MKSLSVMLPLTVLTWKYAINQLTIINFLSAYIASILLWGFGIVYIINAVTLNVTPYFPWEDDKSHIIYQILNVGHILIDVGNACFMLCCKIGIP